MSWNTVKTIWGWVWKALGVIVVIIAIIIVIKMVWWFWCLLNAKTDALTGAAPTSSAPATPGTTPAPAPVTPPAPPPTPAFAPPPAPPPDNSAQVLEIQLQNYDKRSLLDALRWAETRILYPGVAEVVTGQLISKDAEISAEAQRILIAGRGAVVEPLVQSLETSEEARLKGLDCLFYIGTPSVDPLLKKMAETPNYFTRESIKVILVKLRDDALTGATTRAKLEAGKRNLDARISLASDQVLRAP